MDETEFLIPRILRVKEISIAQEKDPGKAIMLEKPQDLSDCSVEIINHDKVSLKIRNVMGKGIAVLLDFGRTVAGTHSLN